MDELIRDLKVIVCAGSGGVGKTTISACLGILAAKAGKRTLVLTIDPARRLATALGMKPGQTDIEVEVPEQDYPGKLYAAMINPAKVFNEFVLSGAPDQETADRLLHNRLYKQLATTLNGSQEFTSLERLLQSVESRDFDLVILDTPPTQHAIDFLSAPEKIFALFQESITRWFISGTESKGLLQSIFNRGTRTVLAALEKVTGATFVTELSDFFKHMSTLQSTVSRRSIEVHRLLTSASTGFVLVTGFDEAKLKEANEFYDDLRRGGYSLSGVIVNRSFPEWVGDEEGEETADSNNSELRDLLHYYRDLRGYYRGRQQVYDQFQHRLGPYVPMARLPELKDNVYGLEGLERLAQRLHEKMTSGG